VKQAVGPQAYGAQAWVCWAGHAPAPSQLAARTPVPAAHEAARQGDDAPGYVHARLFVPLQVPPQAEPSVAHAPRPPTGAPMTGQHVPTWPPTLHASHWPEQAVPQHTPSTQLPDEHWFAAEQTVPLPSFGTQAPPPQ
jgi:hypothetical protein